MKKTTTLILMLSILSLTQCAAQNKLHEGEVKGRREMFLVKRMKPILNEPETTILVSSKRNKYDKGIPYPKDPKALPMNRKTDMKVDTGAIRLIVYNILANRLTQLKQNHEKLTLDLVFVPTGELSDITFFLNKNTIITGDEIEEMDLKMRENIRAKFSGKYYEPV